MGKKKKKAPLTVDAVTHGTGNVQERDSVSQREPTHVHAERVERESRIPTPADAASQLPAEGVEARQLPADVLPGGRAQLGGAGASAQVQRGLGADGGGRRRPREAGRARGGGGRGGEAGGGPGGARGRGGDGGAVAGGRGVGGGRGRGGGQVQGPRLPADRGAEGELAAVHGGGSAGGDGEGRGGRKLAAEPRGLVVQRVRRPRTLVGGEEELQRPERDGVRVDPGQRTSTRRAVYCYFD